MLEKLDLTLKLGRAEYDQRVEVLQNQLHLLGYEVYRANGPARA